MLICRSFPAAVLVMAFAAGASGAVFPDGPFSDKAAGATGAAFLKLPAGARIPSFGGSYAAAADNAEAMFWNPAGLSRLEGAGRPEAAVGYLSLLETMYSGSLAYAHPLANQRGVVGASFLYFSQSPMQGYDPRGDPTSRFTPNDLAHSVGYGTLLGPVRLGGAVKFIRSAIDDACGSTFALDFGIQADRVTDIGGGPLDLGLSVQNFGPPIKLGSMSDPLPFKMAIGGLWRIIEVKRTKLSGLVDAHMPVDADPYFSLGAEFIQSFDEGFSVQVRSGYNMRNARGLDELAGVAAGLGMDLRRVRLDYAWVPFGELGTTHRVALGYRF